MAGDPLLDTSVVVRYLMQDGPDHAPAARRLIESDTRLIVSNVVLAEAAFVLRSNYGVERAAIVDRLIRLVRRTNIRTFPAEKATILDALLLCRPSGRVSFADALLWSAARDLDSTVYTFDARFPRESIDVRHP